MARTTGKKQSKPTQPVSAQATVPSPSTSIPEPFGPIPAQLRPLTSTLPTDHVYTVHVDSTPVELKKRVFVVPVLMNLIIAICLLVRAIYAAPTYVDQIITIFGYETAWKVQPDQMSFNDLLSVIGERTGLLMMDYAIFGFIGSWPWEFFIGSRWTRRTSPIDWRRKVGFQNKEIIVRKGRKWDKPLFEGDDKTWTREEELSIMYHVEPAIAKQYTSKTGYLLLDKDYDLDFKGMIDAHRLVEKDRLDMKDLDHLVLVHYKKQWLIWRPHAKTEALAPKPEDDAEVRNFRERLAALDCEDIFFRWIEIIQFETSLPGGFSEERQSAAVRELRRLLAEKKINQAKFWDEVGGLSAVPGLTKR